MAAKRKLSFEDSDVKGYLYNISKIELSANGKTKYFTGTFQSAKSEINRLVSFSPEKHEEFVRASTINKPVKLKNATLSPGRDGLEIKVNRTTLLEVCTTPLSFTKDLNFSSDTTDDDCPTSIGDIDKEDMKVTFYILLQQSHLMISLTGQFHPQKNPAFMGKKFLDNPSLSNFPRLGFIPRC